jgi:NTE family protein
VKQRVDISLALGGGGSRGFAHIGVLQQLQSAGIRIRAIAGTSAGGMVACFYAAGFSPDSMEKIAIKIDQNKLYSLYSNSGPGLLGLSNPIKIFEEYLGDREFSDLEIPCAVVAVDLKTNREIILNKGRVVDAILATIAVPGIFPPMNISDYELVDGGVVNPVPVSVARKLAPKLPVVAVVLSPLIEKPGRIVHISLPVKVPSTIINRISHSRLAQAFSIFFQSIEIGQRMITELRLEVDKPEIVIRPDVENIGLLDKVDIPSIINLGNLSAKNIYSQLVTATSWTNRWRKRHILK